MLYESICWNYGNERFFMANLWNRRFGFQFRMRIRATRNSNCERQKLAKNVATKPILPARYRVCNHWTLFDRLGRLRNFESKLEMFTRLRTNTAFCSNQFAGPSMKCVHTTLSNLNYENAAWCDQSAGHQPGCKRSRFILNFTTNG